MNLRVVVATFDVKYEAPVVKAVSNDPEYGDVIDGNAASAS
jgi:hypothetical protein